MTEAQFWHRLLIASKFLFANPLKPPKKSEGAHLCLQRFITIARGAKANYVVLLIDEAQDMTLKEWEWLVTLQNELDDAGFLLSVFSIGTHQLGYKYEYLASTGNAHVAARFMASHAKFHGIRKIEEAQFVLTGYDVDSEWPPGSGVSFLQCFAPTSFARGKRLADKVDFLWRALEELRPFEARSFNEYPMQHIAFTVEGMLQRLAKGEDWEEVTSYDSWLTGLTSVDYADHMRIIATSG